MFFKYATPVKKPPKSQDITQKKVLEIEIKKFSYTVLWILAELNMAVTMRLD